MRGVGGGIGELVLQAQAGDPAAIARLLETTQPDIRRYARRACRVDDVDDAVQHALWRISTRISALKSVAALTGWLFIIIRRECGRLARATRLPWAPVDALADDLRFSTMPELDLRYDLAAAIESLPAHYREVLLLRDIEEFTIDEIATRLDTTRETTKSRLHRARLMVREYLLA